MTNKIIQFIKLAFAYSAISLMFFSTPAFAYVDPGSGSIIVTTILGLVAAVSYTFRKFFYNLRAKFFGKKDQEEDRTLDD